MEAELHRPVLLLECANILTKLLINLADHPVQPVLYICIGQFNLLVHFDGFIVELLRSLDLDMKLMDLGIGGASSFNLDIWLLVLHLQLVELFCHLLVLMPQHVQLLLVVADGLKKLRVRGLPCEELLHDLLNIGETRLRSNLLESLLNLSSACHFLLHLVLKESAPEFLSQEVLVHLQLIRVLVVICSLVTDLLLASVSLDTPLQGSFLII